ncbi:MAG: alpha/beta hydrolase [Chthoniobacteraceae bacterium]
MTTPLTLIALALFVPCALAADVPPNAKLDIPYKTAAKRVLNLDLYYPEAKVPGPYPVVIYTHGGGWAAGSKQSATNASMGKVVSGLTAHGFCVAAVDYRLYEKDGQITIKDCVTDCKDAIRYLAKNYDALSVDTSRVFTFGDSAGGQIAQMLLLTPPESLPGTPELAGTTYTTIAGVSWYGPCDFEKTELFNPDGRADFRDRFGPRILKPDSDPNDKLRLYREMSPVSFLTKDSPPLLMIQGDKDTTIPVHHARYMKERAEAIHAPVEILIVENAGHNWRSVGAEIKPTRDEIVERTVAFLRHHLDQLSKK